LTTVGEGIGVGVDDGVGVIVGDGEPAVLCSGMAQPVNPSAMNNSATPRIKRDCTNALD
jgi:hypothetical protein